MLIIERLLFEYIIILQSVRRCECHWRRDVAISNHFPSLTISQFLIFILLLNSLKTKLKDERFEKSQESGRNDKFAENLSAKKLEKYPQELFEDFNDFYSCCRIEVSQVQPINLPQV